MRKVLALLAGATMVASFGIGHADTAPAPLAQCSGATGLKGVDVPPNINPSYSGSCSTRPQFTLAADTVVAITLTADPGFTGPLHAYLIAVNTCTPPTDPTLPPCPPLPSSDTQASASYIAGQLVQGFGAGTTVGTVPAGTWSLRVDTSGALLNPSQKTGTPGHLAQMDTAVGTFSASVAPAPSGS